MSFEEADRLYHGAANAYLALGNVEGAIQVRRWQLPKARKVNRVHMIVPAIRALLDNSAVRDDPTRSQGLLKALVDAQHPEKAHPLTTAAD